MRTRLAASALLVGAVALAQDAPRKRELVYRWDQLDGRTALYDVEIVTSRSVDRATSTDDEGTDTSPRQFISTHKARVSLAFKAGDRARGLVTVTNLSFRDVMTQRTKEGETSFEFDSSKPEKRVPDDIRPQIDAMMAQIGKSYTLTVSRRGVVEKVEGRPAKDLPSLKGSFLKLPESPLAAGESWGDVRRTPNPPFGDIVNRATYKLASVNDANEWRVESAISTELDDSKSTLDMGVVAHLENPVGRGRVTFDARGLKLEEESSQGYDFSVRQASQSVDQHHRFLTTERWKLIEVR